MNLRTQLYRTARQNLKISREVEGDSQFILRCRVRNFINDYRISILQTQPSIYPFSKFVYPTFDSISNDLSQPLLLVVQVPLPRNARRQLSSLLKLNPIYNKVYIQKVGEIFTIQVSIVKKQQQDLPSIFLRRYYRTKTQANRFSLYFKYNIRDR